MVAHYGLQVLVDHDGSTRHPSKLEQHHVELLQAMTLTVPAEDWSSQPSNPAVVQSIFGRLPALADAFVAGRIMGAGVTGDPAQSAVSELQVRLRLHTQGVRNWGNFGDVTSMMSELCAPLNGPFLERHGFAASDIVLLASMMVRDLERRTSERMAWLGEVRSANTPIEVLRRYYRMFPQFSGTPEQELAVLPGKGRLSAARKMVRNHADARLRELCTWTGLEVAHLTGLPRDRVQAAMRAISLKPGALVGVEPERLFLANPVWLAPIIDLGDKFVVPMPQAITSHVHGILRNLAAKVELAHNLDRARARFLEAKAGSILMAALPGATFRANVAWRLGGERFETDLLALLDGVLVIVECKAHHLTPEGLRGAPDRVRRHVRNLVVEPAIQSQRLARAVEDARRGDPVALVAMRDIGIEAGCVERITRVSMTLDDLTILASAEGVLRDAGWVPAELELAPTMTVADFACVADMLDEPLPFLHYLSGRAALQRTESLLGNELDFLGLYLRHGLDVTSLPRHDMFAPSGMSEPIDKYYDARDVGITVAKPCPAFDPYFASVLVALNLRRPPDWTLIGLSVLEALDYRQQRKVTRDLDRLRRKLVRSLQHGDQVALTLDPDLPGRPFLVFLINRLSTTTEVIKAMQSAAAVTMASGAGVGCVVVARHLDRWDEPFQDVLQVRAAPKHL